MKLFTSSAAILLAALEIASATPAQPLARQAVVVTLEGAGPNPPSYTLTPSFDGTPFTIGIFPSLSPNLGLSMSILDALSQQSSAAVWE